ncbi:MAG: hypothetical protein K0S07_1135 [Chlamydiales bacterium]|jgi:hypothetical protein|nr:hypothetical protein [Chlamydiales bacterium]
MALSPEHEREPCQIPLQKKLMKYSFTGDQRFHFEKTGSIIFERFVSDENLKIMHEQALNVAVQRGEKTKIVKSRLTPQQALLQGRDLYKDAPKVRSFAAKRGVVNLVLEITGLQSVRLAFDQLIVTSKAPLPEKFLHPSLATDLVQREPLSSLSCIRGLTLSAILCLESDSVGESVFLQKETFSLSDLKPGDLAFLEADQPFPFDELYGKETGEYLLIAYAEPQALYTLHERDIHTHLLKREGYVFGDRLKDPYHPLLFRRF